MGTIKIDKSLLRLVDKYQKQNHPEEVKAKLAENLYSNFLKKKNDVIKIISSL